MDATRRQVLDRLADGPVAGPALAERLSVSRAAIWKHVEALREAGFEIDSTDAGYVLEGVPEYGGAAVALGLEAPYEVEYVRSVESTNDLARELARAGRAEVLVLADEQPAGRGRLGREWAGPAGGIYLSLLLRPDLAPMEVPILTLAAAVATVEAVAETGIETTIKWPNDVLHADAKLAGILTEMEGEADRVNWAIVGIGLNANVDRAELPEGATSLSAIRGDDIVRRDIVQDLVQRFHAYRTAPDEILPAWRARADTIGQRVRVETGTGTVEGIATDVVHPGSLVVETGDETVRVHAGDCEHLRPQGN